MVPPPGVTVNVEPDEIDAVWLGIIGVTG